MVNGVLVSLPLIGFSIKFYDFLLGGCLFVLGVLFSESSDHIRRVIFVAV